LIRIYTKSRHTGKIRKFLELQKIQCEIYTIYDSPKDSSFDLGVSYCYPRKIKNPLLSKPKKGFVNYHPGLLPKYKGPTELDDAIKNQEINWGVTLHQMDEEYDSGKIIKIKQIKLHEPPTSTQELGAISHYYLFNLFKETIVKIYNS
jgi:methionyl-tRNA formyltransferase|tara:strand:- start:394 stop:837 length:444 start_codon:yes stop_codon:yes gene_type:complete